MADLQPLHTLRYEPSVVGSLEDVIAPPYDVIDAELRAQLAARSPYNVVEIDLPPSYDAGRRHDGRLARSGACSCSEDEPAVWVLRQDYEAPDGDRPHAAPASSRACAWTSTGRAASARTSAPTRAPRRTGSSSRAPRAPTSPPSSACSPTPTAPPAARWTQIAGGRAVRVGGRPRRHGQHALALRRRGPGRRAPDGAGRRRAADRRRPPPLRDRARVRGGGRRRGRAPLRADAALLAVRPGPARLPHPPAADRPQGRQREAAGHPRRAHARLRDRASSTTRAELEPPDATAGRLRLHGLLPPAALPRDAQGPVDRRPRAGGHARALPPARHRGARGARAARRARHVRGRHLPPARARLLQGPGRRDRRGPDRPRRRRLLHARHAGRAGAARWRRPASRCRPSRPTSTRRSRPAWCSIH